MAVYGDYLVFPVAGSPLVDDPTVLPVRELVTMPTPGVYAEGILGKCDSCEFIDPDRFWNWKDSPCGDDAPPVDEPPAPQAGAKPGDLKADLIGNLITFGSVPNAPDSVLRNLISALVSSADGGSSEASALLGKLLDAVKEALKPPPARPRRAPARERAPAGTGSGPGPAPESPAASLSLERVSLGSGVIPELQVQSAAVGSSSCAWRNRWGMSASSVSSRGPNTPELALAEVTAGPRDLPAAAASPVAEAAQNQRQRRGGLEFLRRCRAQPTWLDE